MFNKIRESQKLSLFQSAIQGDRASQALIYESYFTPVFRYIYLRVRIKEEAEDLAQTVFLKFYKALAQGRFTYKKEPLAYLFTIARNSIIDHLRKKKPEANSEIENLAGLSDNGRDVLLERKNNSQTLNTLLDTLKEEQKTIIILKFINGYSTKEIAQILDQSENNVRQIQCRALKQLKEKARSPEINERPNR